MRADAPEQESGLQVGGGTSKGTNAGKSGSTAASETISGASQDGFPKAALFTLFAMLSGAVALL